MYFSITDYKVLTDSRASAILYRFLIQQSQRKTIILPVNICPIVPAVVEKARYKIEYVDIHPSDLCPNEEIIQQKILSAPETYSGFLYNYSYGIEIDKNSFFEKSKNEFKDIWIIEDRCTNFPCDIHSPHCDLTIFGTGYAKQIDLGYGGYGFIKNKYGLLKGQRESFEVTPGDKIYIIEINNAKNKSSEYFTEIEQQKEKVLMHKLLLNEIYSKYLPVEIQMDARFQSWRFNIVVENKQLILERIFRNGLFASSHFTPLQGSEDDFPVAYGLQSKVINLFNDLYYSEQQAYNTCKIINRYL